MVHRRRCCCCPCCICHYSKALFTVPFNQGVIVVAWPFPSHSTVVALLKEESNCLLSLGFANSKRRLIVLISRHPPNLVGLAVWYSLRFFWPRCFSFFHDSPLFWVQISLSISQRLLLPGKTIATIGDFCLGANHMPSTLTLVSREEP